MWASPNDAAGVADPAKAAPVQAFLTKEFCERARKDAEEARSGSTYWVFCLPDTIDPRGPKGSDDTTDASAGAAPAKYCPNYALGLADPP